MEGEIRDPQVGDVFIIWETEADGLTIKDKPKDKFVRIVEVTAKTVWVCQEPIEMHSIEFFDPDQFQDLQVMGVIEFEREDAEFELTK